MKSKVVLAFSGGLDTSFCVKYLSDEKGYEVHSVIVNTGGFDAAEVAEIERKAYALGVTTHRTIDITEQYYQQCIKYMIFGNMLKNNTYPMSVSSERIFQAMAIVDYARQLGAKAIAHGSTGAGNDQVRFDLVFQIMMPEAEIITPIRDLKLSRDEEIDYLKKKGVQDNWERKSAYSINKGLWGTSVGGRETLNSATWLPDDAYPTPLQKDGEEIVELTFKQGEITAVNGQEMKAIDAIRLLEKLGGAYAVGRDTHVGDTIIGIKGRVGFEAAAPLILIKAHHLLEKHTLTKWQQYWKDQLSVWYGMLLHEAQYLEPVMRDIEQFLLSSQKYVSGKVFVKLMPYHFEVKGIESDHDLMNAKFAKYGEEMTAFNGQDVVGFTKILSNQMKIWYAVNQESIEK